MDETSGVHNPTSLESVFGRLERFPVPTIAAVQASRSREDSSSHCIAIFESRPTTRSSA